MDISDFLRLFIIVKLSYVQYMYVLYVMLTLQTIRIDLGECLRCF